MSDNKLDAILIDIFGYDQLDAIKNSKNLFYDGFLDSFTSADLAVKIEEVYKFNFDSSDMAFENFMNYNSLSELLKSK